MAAKTIQEAVKIGTKDLLADQEYLIKELRDFASHMTMKVDGKASKQFRQATAIELFEAMFSSISALKK